jgi:hypothetical protein
MVREAAFQHVLFVERPAKKQGVGAVSCSFYLDEGVLIL